MYFTINQSINQSINQIITYTNDQWFTSFETKPEMKT